MKKKFILFLALVLTLSLAACSGNNSNPVAGGDTPHTYNTAGTTNTPAEGTQVTTENTTPSNTEPPTTNPPATTPSATTPSATTTEPGHVHSFATTVTAPTCTQVGNTYYYCNCGFDYSDNFLDPLGHQYRQWETIKVATTTSTGTQQRTCSRCGAIDVKTLGKIIKDHVHRYDTKEVIKEPTCVEGGIVVYHCDCGDSYTAYPKPADNHDIRLVETVLPTCEADGYEKSACIYCGLSFVTYEERYYHCYKAVEIPATCTESGLYTEACIRCNHVRSSHVINPLGHAYSPIVCETDNACIRCGALKYIKHLISPKFGCQYCGIGWCEYYGHAYGPEVKCTTDYCDEYDPEILAIADRILSEIIKNGMSEYEKVRAIYEYIARNTRYDMENYKNDTVPPESYTPRGILLYGTAVCNGYAETFDLLCLFAGIESKYVRGTGMGGLHAWNQVKIDGNWYNVDVTWDDTNDERILQYKFFLISDDKFYRSHTAETEKHVCETSYKGTHPSGYLY